MEYDTVFYKKIYNWSLVDGWEIIPQIIKWLSPRSIVDFGCGSGTWLSIAREIDQGIEVCGIDGEYMDRNCLDISDDLFLPHDLAKPIELKKKYDLAISTEVAEHLDKEYADVFVRSVALASDNILFSAAIPGQGGTSHVNEQWQEYWKGKFEKQGFRLDYSVRNSFWDNGRIQSWRRQNLMFFTKRESDLAPKKEIVNVVHPGLFLDKSGVNLMAYYLSNPDTVRALEKGIEAALKKYNEIVIYPYGNNGKLCKYILNYQYKVREVLVCDNILCEKNPNILSVSELDGIVGEKHIVLETCQNTDIHDTVLEELLRYVPQERVYSVFR
ncbi:MAG: class I SAM-dependent methyltransferase [Lachnospiraceae bacterium]|nr:class I SAM-dependent methyltransferase [Lachnospiraceae bacterium]